MNLGEASKDLVERSRLGDQNAIAILVILGQEAKKGSLRARIGKTAIEKYIKENPPADMGADDIPPAPPHVIQDAWKARTPAALVVCVMVLLKHKDGFQTACTLLANKMHLDARHLIGMASQFQDGPPQQLFMYGAKNPNSELDVACGPSETYAFLVGQALGRAQIIQTARKPHTRITPLCSMAGWENGE